MKTTIIISMIFGLVHPLFAHIDLDESFESLTKRRLEQCQEMKIDAETLLYDEDFYDSSIIDEYLSDLAQDFQKRLGLINPQDLSDQDKGRFRSDQYIKCAHYVSHYLTALKSKESLYIWKLSDLNQYFKDLGNQRDNDNALHALKLEHLAKVDRVLSKMLEFENTWPSRDAFRMQINDYLEGIDVHVEWH